MSTNEQLAIIAEQICDEITRLNMEQAVQDSAYAVLVRHLAAQGFVNLDTLIRDLDRQGSMKGADAGWKPGHAKLAGVLQLLRDSPETRQQ